MAKRQKSKKQKSKKQKEEKQVTPAGAGVIGPAGMLGLIFGMHVEVNGEDVTPTFDQEYEAARQIGDRKFGAECLHEKGHGGRCKFCGRKLK